MKGSTTPSDFTSRKQINALKPKLITKYIGDPKKNFRHRESIYSSVELGKKVERKFLDKIKLIRGYEQVYDCKGYFASVVIYPKGEKIISFDKILAEVKALHRDQLLPVHVLVASGVFGNWFALYFRKYFQLRKGFY